MITISSTSPKASLPPLLRVREIARILSVSRTTVHHLIDSGDLKACEINPSQHKERRHRRVIRNSLLSFYKKRFGHSLNRAMENPYES